MVIFGLIACFVVAIVVRLFVPKWNTNRWSPSNTLVSFYRTPGNSLDVIFYGSSVIGAAVDPFQLYQDYGISSYNLGLQGQNLRCTYSWLEESLSYQNPKVAVVEVKALSHLKEKDESRTRFSFDYMRWGKAKLQFAMNYCRDIEDASLSSFLFSPVLYHSRWDSLEESDFAFLAGEGGSLARGFSMLNKVTPKKKYQALTGTGNPEGAGYLESETVYLRKIIERCKEEGIELILTKTFDKQWDEDMHAYAKAIADEYGLPFFDFNMENLVTELKLNPMTDIDDSVHVNLQAAQKITGYFGDYLKANYELTDHRSIDSAAHKDFEKGMADYQALKNDRVLSMQGNFTKWLKIISEHSKQYTVLAAMPKASVQLTTAQGSLLGEIGFSDKFKENIWQEETQICAALSKGKGKSKFSEKKEVAIHKMLDDETIIDISASEEKCSITVDENRKIDGSRMVSFVVYDQVTGTVADAISITNDDNGNVVIQR